MRSRILGVVRTLTALDRLHDVFPLVADDVRVEMRFTLATGSEFTEQLAEHVRRCGMHLVEWTEAGRADFDLAVSPSSNGSLHELDMPLVTLPHGSGYHKYRATESGLDSAISGLSREQLVHDDEVVPTVLGLSHRNQVELLHRSCPEAVPRSAVIGDPCYDRLRASLPAREHYRSELGASGQTLVVLASTWDERSLFGRQPELAWRLISALGPRYRVALILHPNAWNRHSPFQIRQWTRRARAAGMLLIPPDRGWRATLVAADLVISDHGSLALYAAALGKSLLLAEFGDAEVAPGTPIAALGERAARLDPTADLRAQVEAARPVPEHDRLERDAFDPVGTSAGRLRRVLYEQLSMPEPSWQARAEPVDPFTP